MARVEPERQEEKWRQVHPGQCGLTTYLRIGGQWLSEQCGHVVDLHDRLEDFGTVQLPQEPLSVHKALAC